jgi:hypothetical protein
MRTQTRSISSHGLRGVGRAFALAALLACACEVELPPNYADPRPGDAVTSGGESTATPPDEIDLDDDERIAVLFPELQNAERTASCAPLMATWVIVTYEPVVLDEHRVQTRELHCTRRVVDERCKVVSEVRYYLDDPDEYFAVDGKMSPERALRIARLAHGWASEMPVAAIAGAEKAGVYLVTLSRCGAEKQLATRLEGSGKEQRLEVIETRYSIEL